MDTIYSNLIKYRKFNFESLNNDLQKSIFDKIVVILERTTDHDYSNLQLKSNGDLLERHRGNIFSISFTFQHGWLTLKSKDSTDDQSIRISLHVNDPNAPNKYVAWTIITDHNLNIILCYSDFYYAGFSKKSLGLANNHFTVCNLKFRYSIEANKDYNQIFYMNTQTEKDIYFDTFDYGLNESYSVRNDEFEKWLHIFMECSSRFPEALHDLFPDYPKYIDIIYDINQAVLLLNAFKHDYDHRFNWLKNQILLMEMYSI